MKSKKFNVKDVITDSLDLCYYIKKVHNFRGGIILYKYYNKHYKNWLIAREKKDRTILTYLEKYYYEVFHQNIRHSFYTYSEKTIKIVWQFWWQGEKNMPLIVERCIESVKKNNPECKHIIITKENFKKYLDIPQYILDKVNIGTITITHLSDILRMGLLAKYGGIWLDSTIFCVGAISNTFGSSEFYTCKTIGGHSECCADYYWTCYAMSSVPNHIIPSMMYRLFLLYWKKENNLIDYFLVDYFMKLLYEKEKTIKKILDNNPINNVDRGELVKILDEPLNMDKLSHLFSNNQIFKLTYKSKFKKISIDGKQTNFAYLMGEYENK